jgi:hypothetical protein
MKYPTIWAFAAVLAVGTVTAETPTDGETRAGNSSGLTYFVSATEPRLNRRVMGAVQRTVQGVASEPVDSMTWNGVGSIPIEGSLDLSIDPVTNTGFIKARWTDSNGDWVFTQRRFLHPEEHSSGVRMGASVDSVDTVINEAVAHNVYLHGDTAAGMGVLPTVFTLLATWGPADVYLNGEHFRNPFEVPAPQWEGHLMVTEGVRRADGTVRTLTGDIYNPGSQDQGAVETGDLEVHLTFHDDAFPVTQNIPPIFSFFYHLVFEEVRVDIRHIEPDQMPQPGGTRDATEARLQTQRPVLPRHSDNEDE